MVIAMDSWRSPEGNVSVFSDHGTRCKSSESNVIILMTDGEHSTNVCRKENKLLNPKRKALTPKKLRELSVVDLSDEQAKKLLVFKAIGTS